MHVTLKNKEEKNLLLDAHMTLVNLNVLRDERDECTETIPSFLII